MALICGLFIAFVYRWSYRGTSYTPSYVQSLVAFAMITTIVIMVIGNNLARAFGLVGSMSIVRFRMAIKDTRDIVFIFFTLAIGMACGVGQHLVAVASTIYIGIIILFLSFAGFGSQHKREYLLHFYYEAPNGDDATYLDVMKDYCRKYKLINAKSVGDSDTMELSYYVTLKKMDQIRHMIKKLGSVDGLSNINLFFDEE